MFTSCIHLKNSKGSPLSEEGPQIAGGTPPMDEVRQMAEVMKAQCPARLWALSFELAQGLEEQFFKHTELPPVVLVVR